MKSEKASQSYEEETLCLIIGGGDDTLIISWRLSAGVLFRP
jgi:hypothetical protein